LESLRPHAALEALKGFDLERTKAQGLAVSHYIDWLSMTYHMLGDHRRELATAQAGLRRVPGPQSRVSARFAIALAALGREREVQQLVEEWLDHPDPGAEFSQSEVAECVVLELRAHGHAAASQRLLAKVVGWYGQHGIDQAAKAGSYPCVWYAFSAFYYAGRWHEARLGYEHWIAEDTMSLKAYAALGALAVRRRDHREAKRINDWLKAKEGHFHATHARARMAALQGDREAAVTLLRQAFDQRLNARMFLHLDPDFESLHDYPPYQELMRPKG
jgi:hypothetical protein